MTKAGTPTYMRLADEVRRAIESGTYPPGSQVPSESELAAEYEVSRGTVRQTYSQLEAEGRLVARRGSRRIVTAGPRTQSFDRLVSFSHWVKGLGMVPTGRVISFSRHSPGPEEQAQLGADPDDTVFRLVRLRLIDGRPAMIERSSYRSEPGLIVAGLDLVNGSITDALSARGFVYAHAHHTIDAVGATAEDARLLESTRRHPLLRVRRLTTDDAGRPVEWSEDRYLPEVAAFVIVNSSATNNLSRLQTG